MTSRAQTPSVIADEEIVRRFQETGDELVENAILALYGRDTYDGKDFQDKFRHCGSRFEIICITGGVGLSNVTS